MTLDEAAKILRKMYDEAPENEKAVQFHLFGIKYAEQIKDITKAKISILADLGKSYGAEINKGVNLAKYVVLKDD